MSKCLRCGAGSEWLQGSVAKDSCAWSADEDGNWNTDCEQTFFLEEGGPTENDMRFCCYCGKSLVEVPYSEPQYEDERDD